MQVGSVVVYAARRAHRGCAPPASPRPAPTAGRRPSMAGCPHTPCARDGLWRGPASGKIEGNSNSSTSSKPHPQRQHQQQGDSDRGGGCSQREGRDRVGKESRSQGSMSFQTAGKVVPGAGAGGMPRAGHGWPAAGSGSRTAQIPAGHPPCVRAGPPQPENTNANIPLGWEKNQKKHRREAGVLVSGAAWARGRSATRSRRPTGRWRRRRSRP